MTDKPTDEALENLFVEETGFDIDDFPAAIFDFARAVLAKWGTPAVAEEPFCWHWENTFNGGMGAVKKNPETLGINMAHPDYKWTALYTTQPPTHAQAGAVTDAQVLAAVRVVSPGLFRHGLQPLPNDGANTAAQMRKEADTVRKMLEAAHGIKGGQHG